MVLVRRTPSKYGYSPDKQQAAETVMNQAKIMADRMAAPEIFYETYPTALWMKSCAKELKSKVWRFTVGVE